MAVTIRVILSHLIVNKFDGSCLFGNKENWLTLTTDGHTYFAGILVCNRGNSS